MDFPADRLYLVASSPPNDLFYSSLSLSEIYLEPVIRSRPGIGAPYRTPRTMARSLTMASLAMASGSALYYFACECTGVSCTGCPRNRALPRAYFSSKLESKIFFSKEFDKTHVLFFLTFRVDCFKTIGSSNHNLC